MTPEDVFDALFDAYCDADMHRSPGTYVSLPDDVCAFLDQEYEKDDSRYWSLPECLDPFF